MSSYVEIALDFFDGQEAHEPMEKSSVSVPIWTLGARLSSEVKKEYYLSNGE